MSHPPATRRDHQRFCAVEGWERVRSARGKRGTHHTTYELALPNGDILRTRVSRPPDRTEYGASMFSHILRDQLQVTEEEFWACVRDRVPPDRGQPSENRETIPTDLIWKLRNEVGIPEAEIADMTRKEAIDRMQVYWTTGE